MQSRGLDPLNLSGRNTESSTEGPVEGSTEGLVGAFTLGLLEQVKVEHVRAMNTVSLTYMYPNRNPVCKSFICEYKRVR